MQLRALAILTTLAALILSMGVGCGHTLQVRIDETHDFSLDRHWDWGTRLTRVIDGEPGAEQELDTLVSRRIAAELRRRGLARAPGRADLLVDYRLELRTELVMVQETPATYLLSSHHSSPSFLIQASEQRLEIRQRGSLQLHLRDARGDDLARNSLVWEGDLRLRSGTHMTGALSREIGRLLESLSVGPAPRPARVLSRSPTTGSGSRRGPDTSTP